MYRTHAIERLFERSISDDDVEACVTNGEDMIIITAYRPDKDKWSDDYRQRIEK